MAFFGGTDLRLLTTGNLEFEGKRGTKEGFLALVSEEHQLFCVRGYYVLGRPLPPFPSKHFFFLFLFPCLEQWGAETTLRQALIEVYVKHILV